MKNDALKSQTIGLNRPKIVKTSKKDIKVYLI